MLSSRVIVRYPTRPNPTRLNREDTDNLSPRISLARLPFLRSVLREVVEDGDRFSDEPMLNFGMQNGRCFTKPANGLRRQEFEIQSPANRKLLDCVGGSFRRRGGREVRKQTGHQPHSSPLRLYPLQRSRARGMYASLPSASIARELGISILISASFD